MISVIFASEAKPNFHTIHDYRVYGNRSELEISPLFLQQNWENRFGSTDSQFLFVSGLYAHKLHAPCSHTPCSRSHGSVVGLWLSFLIVLFVYVNRIGTPLITFMFLITSIHITCLASFKNGEAEERDKGVGAMVYVATGWTYSEMCVLWKHNAV